MQKVQSNLPTNEGIETSDNKAYAKTSIYYRRNWKLKKTADSQQMYLTVYKALYNYKLTFWWNILKIYFSDISLTFSLSFAEKNFKMAIALLLYNKTINNFMLDKILMISKLINYMFPIGCIQYQQIRIFSNSDTSGCVFWKISSDQIVI